MHRPNVTVQFGEFVRAYRDVLRRRSEIERDLFLHLAIVFTRERTVVRRRLDVLHRTLLAAHVTDFATDTKKKRTVVLLPLIPQVRAQELISDDFETSLDDELRPILTKWAALIGGLLIGSAAFGGPTNMLQGAQRLVDSLLGRLNQTGQAATAEIDAILKQSYQASEPFAVTADKIDGVLARYAATLSALWANVQSSALLGGITSVAARAENIPTQRMWVSVLDGKERETHNIAHGQIRGLNEPFEVGDDLLDYPGDPNGSDAEICNCLPGSSLVIAAGVEKIFRRWYDGPLLTARTRSGRRFTATPNHPVYASDGWRLLHFVHEGDYLIGNFDTDFRGVSSPNVENVPVRIDKIFDALTPYGVRRRMRMREKDFHGDVVADSEVDVVAVESGTLGVDDESAIFEHALDLGLAFTDSPLVSAVRSGPSASVESFLGVASSASGSLGSIGPSAPLLRRRPSLPHDHRLLSIPWSDSSVDEMSPNDLSTHTSLDGERLLGFSVFVALDEVVDIVEHDFQGHVYNLQTASGAYLADGIIAHNCRCSLALLSASGAVTETE